jgi:hypothetical protein
LQVSVAARDGTAGNGRRLWYETMTFQQGSGGVMSRHAKQTCATIVPALQYRDAPAAVDWLCHAFGFEKRMVVPGENNTIAHAELSFGNGMIMLGSRKIPTTGVC